MTENKLYIGLDGGGTKCRAVVFDKNFNELSSAIAGPANIAKYGNLAYEAILEASEQALNAIDMDIASAHEYLYVSAGLAGANVPSAAKALAQWQHPFARFDYTSDLHAAALGAHGGSDGSVLIVGTGSCAAAIKNHKLSQFGGHGFMLGDKGSGAWMGRKGLSLTLEALEGVIPSSDYTHALCEHLGARQPSDLIEQFNQASPASFGALAPMLLEYAHRGDCIALAIVEDAANYLSIITHKALAISKGKLVLNGGVSRAILPWLEQDIAEHVIDAQHGPERGAIIYQQQLTEGLTHDIN
ncbi:BadF/BadG/BcrA/BcrD ATPase family protein [Glaciecola siphonariae]|uniref:BadF/BadG/BcrA/BcrD ATPase family protein n=1 Tax=Glaciecola siphonariae TaxID=521012 RepID=A0ABV9LY77_9ALTE